MLTDAGNSLAPRHALGHSCPHCGSSSGSSEWKEGAWRITRCTTRCTGSQTTCGNCSVRAGLRRKRPPRLGDAARIFVVGIGTSYHAAQIGEALLRGAGSEAYAVGSFDFVTYPPALRPASAVIVMVNRGTRAFSARALALAQGADVTCIGISRQLEVRRQRGQSGAADDPAGAFRRLHHQPPRRDDRAGADRDRPGGAARPGLRGGMARVTQRAARAIEEVLGRETDVQQIADAIVAARATVSASARGRARSRRPRRR